MDVKNGEYILLGFQTTAAQKVERWSEMRQKIATF